VDANVEAEDINSFDEFKRNVSDKDYNQESFESSLQETRSDEKCREFWTEADCCCESLDIPDRVTRKPQRTRRLP